MKSISLYTGAGGLDLGLEAAGFKPVICVELDKDARMTLKLYRPYWPLLEPGDVHAHKPEEIIEQARLRPKETILLSGGPPCQPFSKASFWVNGKATGLADNKAKTLKAYIKVAEVALPQFLLLENVGGNYKSGKNIALEFLKSGIDWINRRNGTKYRWNILYLNAADYGAPQTRKRMYLVADRDGRILQSPYVTHSPIKTADASKPYMTAWDAIGDLDKDKWDAELIPRGKWAELLPSIPEGWNYLWHTNRGGGKPLFGWRTKYWSFLLKLARNRPSWTISASPGPATGPFHWQNRLLSIRELCRLQTFPDNYSIQGIYSSAQRQIGNAVPPLMGEILGKEIRKQWLGQTIIDDLTFLRDRFKGTQIKSWIAPVPKEYLHIIGHYNDHPGYGKGPGARLRKSIR
jgi:DNA (cytosine-5)-methyltransferase 1